MVRIFEKFLKLLDRFFFWFLVGSLDKFEVEYRKYFEKVYKRDGVFASYEHVTVRQAEVDARLSSLLSHISIIIALCGVLVSFVEGDGWEKIAFTAELILYVFLAYLCIRCIQVPPLPRSNQIGEIQDATVRAVRNLAYKRELLRSLNTLVSIATLALSITVGLHFFL